MVEPYDDDDMEFMRLAARRGLRVEMDVDRLLVTVTMEREEKRRLRAAVAHARIAAHAVVREDILTRALEATSS